MRMMMKLLKTHLQRVRRPGERGKLLLNREMMRMTMRMERIDHLKLRKRRKRCPEIKIYGF